MRAEAQPPLGRALLGCALEAGDSPWQPRKRAGLRAPAASTPRATRRGMPVRFFQTATLVLQLGKAKREGTLDRLLADVGRADLIVLDEFGHVPFDVDGGPSHRLEESLMLGKSGSQRRARDRTRRSCVPKPESFP
ncbi:ATP-binding protein [Olsenella sp. Marseille-P4559]|uniref:ATP-binding protein n=1 Tax=Olsenella sp. Marseille-P4559 TaxID=2364795 RepID=UPI00210FA4FD|nr:ATP-binding protein [Olsenella sp. Marseille-P4559]